MNVDFHTPLSEGFDFLLDIFSTGCLAQCGSPLSKKLIVVSTLTFFSRERVELTLRDLCDDLQSEFFYMFRVKQGKSLNRFHYIRLPTSTPV